MWPSCPSQRLKGYHRIPYKVHIHAHVSKLSVPSQNVLWCLKNPTEFRKVNVYMHVSTYFQAVHPVPNVLCMVPQSILQDSERYPKCTIIFSQFPLSFFMCVNQAVCWSKCTARHIMTLYFKKLPWDFVRVAGHAYQKVYPTFALLLLFYYYYYYKDNRILSRNFFLLFT